MGPSPEASAERTIGRIEDLFLLGLLSLQDSRVFVATGNAVQDVVLDQ